MVSTIIQNKTRFFAPMLLVLLMMAGGSLIAHGQATHSPWKMHNGQEISAGGNPEKKYDYKFSTRVDGKTPIEKFFEGAIIPPETDLGWKDAPDTKTINFNPGSKLPACNQYADYTYFQTTVTIPSNVKVTTFTIHFEGMDDASRITVFNDNHREGKVVAGSYVEGGTSGPRDLLADKGLQLSASNRVVITQVDDCPSGNQLQKAEVMLNGVAVDTPSYNGPSGDVHIRTPDGLLYDFQATGDFLLARSSDKNVIVQTRQEPWEKKTGVSINTAAAFWVGGDKIEFYLKPQPSFYLNGTSTTLPSTPTTLSKGGSIAPSGDASRRQFIINWPDGSFTARLIIYSNSHMDVGVARLKGSQTYEGLLGNLDGNLQNDLQIRGGALLKSPGNNKDLNSFGDSWRVPAAGTSLFSVNNPAATSPHTSVVLEAAQEAKAKQQCQNARISDPIALRNCIYDVAVTGNPIFVESAKTFEESIKALPPTACFDAVQGKIAWDYNGNKQWNAPNIQALCKGAESSLEPASCFQQAMNSGVNLAVAPRQAWENASDLCESTLDAASTIQCFTSAINKGTPLKDAIANCDK